MANMILSMPIHCSMFSIPLWSYLTGICWPSAIGLASALLAGRTDLCTAGVFGAGKTRAAAAVIVGLIAIDPSLSIMVCTKENAAAQAFAEHVVSMQLPDILLTKFGRLIGFHETQKRASARTAIDVGSQNCNHILRANKLLLVVVVAFAMRPHRSTRQFWNGLRRFNCVCMTRHNNLVTWTRWLRLPAYPLPASAYGQVITSRPLVA